MLQLSMFLGACLNSPDFYNMLTSHSSILSPRFSLPLSSGIVPGKVTGLILNMCVRPSCDLFFFSIAFFFSSLYLFVGALISDGTLWNTHTYMLRYICSFQVSFSLLCPFHEVVFCIVDSSCFLDMRCTLLFWLQSALVKKHTSLRCGYTLFVTFWEQGTAM